MASEVFNIKANVWPYLTPRSTYFLVTIPKKESIYIRERFESQKRGFGSIRVTATIGTISWKTSIFPDSKNKETYFMLLKAEVRKKAGITEGNAIEFTIEI